MRPEGPCSSKVCSSLCIPWRSKERKNGCVSIFSFPPLEEFPRSNGAFSDGKLHPGSSHTVLLERCKESGLELRICSIIPVVTIRMWNSLENAGIPDVKLYVLQVVSKSSFYNNTERCLYICQNPHPKPHVSQETHLLQRWYTYGIKVYTKSKTERGLLICQAVISSSFLPPLQTLNRVPCLTHDIDLEGVVLHREPAKS